MRIVALVSSLEVSNVQYAYQFLTKDHITPCAVHHDAAGRRILRALRPLLQVLPPVIGLSLVVYL